jgi:hypothetical protein
MSSDESKEQNREDRRAFEAVVVFVGAAVAQLFIPFPLNLFIVPVGAATWWYTSEVESAAMTYAYANREVALETSKTYVNSLLGATAFFERCKRGPTDKAPPQTPSDIEDDASNASNDDNGDVFDEHI